MGLPLDTPQHEWLFSVEGAAADEEDEDADGLPLTGSSGLVAPEKTPGGS